MSQLLFLLSLAPSMADTPPTLPLSFTQNFSMSDGSLGVVHYDWGTRQQRVAHFANTATRQNQCYFWYNTTTSCTEYFTPNGDMFVHFPVDGSCCLESCAGGGCREAATPLPRPDFAAACAFRCVVENATHAVGRRVKWYSCPATFNYYVDAVTEVPVLFATADKAYVVIYDVASFEATPQPQQLFALPSSCSSDIKCNMSHPVLPTAAEEQGVRMLRWRW